MKLPAMALVITAACFSSVANGRGDDFVNCRFSDGTRIVQSLCQRLRQEAEQERQRLAGLEEKNRREEEVERARLKERREYEAELQRQREAVAAEKKREQAERQAKIDAEYAKYERETARQEKAAAEQAKAKKERCGSDYGTPRIGMTIERAQECVGKFTLTSQLNRADGVVSTYRSGRIHVHVMNGKIGAWDRY